MIARSLPASLLLAALIVTTAHAEAALPAAVGDTPLPSLAPMVKKVSPTVVNIATSGTIRGGRNPLLDDPFFRRFFEVPPDAQPRERRFQSAGSGVVVDAKNGYIITNAHVIENATEITVTTQDNHNYKAEVVGTDTDSDVAVLKVKQATNLTAIALGDSARVEVGDFVVAIGNPFGLEHTVTSGIVSALGRSGINPGAIEDFIQTDASINPGNSGGALVNLRGELVGVNSAILSGNGGNIGIGFAIPVNMVKSVMQQLIQYGEVKRGLLGVNIYNVTPDILQALGASPDVQGALVSQVVEGSAADKAGIKVNDIITSVNGSPVKSAPELRRSIALLKVGDTVEVGLLRDGNPRKVKAVIAERQPEADIANAGEIFEGLDGAALANVDNDGGVQVRAVEPQSSAANAGLRPNDVIIGVNRTRIANTKQLRQAVEGQNLLLLNVRRGNAVLVLQVR